MEETVNRELSIPVTYQLLQYCSITTICLFKHDLRFEKYAI